jgi:predicted transcriptional regulator
MSDDSRLKELVAEVAAAYFSNTHVNPADIPSVIAQIASSLSAVGPTVSASADEVISAPDAKKPTPAQIRKSITDESLVSFEDGKAYKALKRHLTLRGLTPAEYRVKWGLPADYPMTAPSYSARRSVLAKQLGLGRKSAGARG